MHMTAKVRGDVTLFHIDGIVELCHGYPRAEEDVNVMIGLEICVVWHGHKLYGRTRSGTGWHVYTLNVSSEVCTLFVDGRCEISSNRPVKKETHAMMEVTPKADFDALAAS